ncbi:MAG: hypothetical protein EAS52_06420, partial [Parapedobacter sp.]
KKTNYLMVLLSAVLVLVAACDKEKVVSADGLPSKAQTYITQHFPEHEILQVVKERDDLKTSYDVYLSEGYNLDFDKNGNIVGVEGSKKLPDSVIPSSILTYVNANYSDYFILDWELDDRGQEVKLSNGMELQFDKNGNFQRID